MYRTSLSLSLSLPLLPHGPCVAFYTPPVPLEVPPSENEVAGATDADDFFDRVCFDHVPLLLALVNARANESLMNEKIRM